LRAASLFFYRLDASGSFGADDVVLAGAGVYLNT
jgi:hypothetical protein